MSDPGNHGWQPASNSPAAGWYVAQGDPPGTERYWNGTSWEGTFRAIGGLSPSAATARPRSDEFPSGAVVLAWIITLVKSIPLAIGAIGLVLFNAISDEIEAETDLDLDDISTAILIVGGAIILVGFALLVGQIVAVTRKRVGQALVWAGILTAIDVLYLLANLPGGDSPSTSLAVTVLAAQAWLFAWLMKLRSAPRSSPF